VPDILKKKRTLRKLKTKQKKKKKREREFHVEHRGNLSKSRFINVKQSKKSWGGSTPFRWEEEQGTRVSSQGLTRTRQVLYHLSHSASSFLCWVLLF
jgi:adenine-specific DNA glycosylase